MLVASDGLAGSIYPSKPERVSQHTKFTCQDLRARISEACCYRPWCLTRYPYGLKEFGILHGARVILASQDLAEFTMYEQRLALGPSVTS